MNGSEAYLGRLNVATSFSDAKGIPKASLQKRQLELLDRAQGLVLPVLEPGEEIWYAAEAVSPYGVLELLTTGWILSILKRSLLVFTDRRILHLPANSRWRPKRSIAQVRYGDLQAMKFAGILGRELRLVYRSGKKETFRLLRREADRKLRALFPSLPVRPDGTAAAAREFLCPRCAKGLKYREFRCGSCGMEFRSLRRAAFWSVLLPGGGYFYTGHPILGILDGIFELLLLLFLIGALFGMSAGDPGAGEAAGIFAVILTLEKLLTIFHASHYVEEFLPARP